MLFNSLPFLFAFLPVTYFVFWRLRTRDARYVWLTITGYVFYGAWNWRFCFLMAFSTLVSYTAGLGMLRARDDDRHRKLCLVVPIVVDLALLGFFKYANFALSTTGNVASWFGVRWHAPALNVVLPIGISFYTFHTISYVVDSYRRKIVPTQNFFEFSCYVSLFSQLVAGPIVRFAEVREDLEGIDRADRGAMLDEGWSFFVIGLAQKVLLADTIAAVINPALANYRALSTLDTWLCVLGYTYQLYFDFAGYSNMAVGLGRLFGIHIPQNFNSPYRSLNPSDFWRRWHISLSSCLRDYVYIPLGGNRHGEARSYRNLMLTMLIGGLWHGANWTFVVWGAYHGALLAAYRRWGGAWDRMPVLAQRAGMFLLAVIGWVLFRAESMTMAGGLFARMFVPVAGTPMAGVGFLAAVLVVAGAVAHLAPNTFEIRHVWRPRAALGWSVVFGACVLLIYGAQQSPFLYFQF